MPESTCLHIQDRESGPIRAVELHWISVRIGRAAFCEVHLPDDGLDDEVCRLTRKGRTWSVIPATSARPGSVLVEGRPIDGACPLPFDAPFRVGRYCLTLRRDVAAEPEWELYPASDPVPDQLEAESAAAGVAAAIANPGRPGSDPDRWRARWKAAEAHLEARVNRLGSGGQRGAGPVHQQPLTDVERIAYRPPSMSPPPVERPAPVASPPPVAAAWKPPGPAARPGAARVAPPSWPTPDPEPRRAAVETRTLTREETFHRAPPNPGRGRADRRTEGAETREPGAAPRDSAPFPERDLERVCLTPSGPSVAAPSDKDPHTPVVEELSAFDCPALEPEPAIAGQSRLAEVEPVQPMAVAEPVAPAAIEVEEAPSFEDESSYSVDLIPDGDDVSVQPPAEAPPRRRARFTDVPPAGSNRAADRGPRRRRPARRSRRDLEAESVSDEHVAAPFPGTELPSVRDILTIHRNSPGPRPAVERPGRPLKTAVPTVPSEPGHWELPAWFAVPPAAITALGVGLMACVLSWWWAMDSSNGSLVTRRLLAVDGSARHRPLPETLQPPGGRWIRTTAQHLAHWAIASAAAEPADEQRAPDVVATLTRALDISPLNPTARLAMSQLEGTGGEGQGRIRGLGLSRDSVSLAWSARRLMDSGKKEAALRMYHRALAAAADGGLSRSVTPRFAEDVQPRRVYYLLPSEDAVRDIVAELATRGGLDFHEWSQALPHNPVVLLATARILRERDRPEADALLDRILGDDWGAAGRTPVDPRLLAARGEALMLRGQWPEAAEQYRLAIDRVDSDLIRRSWWFNLADIAQRRGDESQRQAALRAALAASSSDDISRRVGLLQKSADAKPRPRAGLGTARAN